MAIEVKASTFVHNRMLNGLRALAEEKLIKKHIVVSLDPDARTLDGIDIVPWEQFLSSLWGRKWL